MNKKIVRARTLGTFSAPGLMLLALYPVPGLALEFPVTGAPLCFGFGTVPYYADILPGIPGSELVSVDIKDVVSADDDGDGFRVVKTTATVRVYDRAGNEQWSSEKLELSSPDLATVISGGGIVPDTFHFPSVLNFSPANFFLYGGFTCTGAVSGVEVGGQKYVVAMVGFATQTGDDPATGEDKSRINVWVLDQATGALVKTHKIRPVPNKFLASFYITGINDVDGDGDDELVTVRANRGTDIIKLKHQTYGMLSGNMKEEFSVTTKHTRTFK